MLQSHQDIDSTLANVFKHCVLRLAPESEDIFKEKLFFFDSYLMEIIRKT